MEIKSNVEVIAHSKVQNTATHASSEMATLYNKKQRACTNKNGKQGTHENVKRRRNGSPTQTSQDVIANIQLWHNR